MSVAERGDGGAALVHERHRLRQHDVGRRQASTPRFGEVGLGGERDVHPCCERLDQEKSHVVPRAAIPRAGIPETDDEQHPHPAFG